MRKVTLGTTRFSQVAYPPSITWSFMYADRYSYAEAHWLSGAAGFQTMVVGNNYLGKPSLASWDGMMGIYGRVSPSEAKRIAPSRRVNVVNTFGMFAPATDMFGPITPKQFVERGGWLGPTHWDLQSATLSNGNGDSAN